MTKEQPMPNTIEFQEIIPGIKPPKIPLLIPGTESIPLLPGWIIRDAEGNIVNAGLRIPLLMWETAQTPEEQFECSPIFRDPCKVEGEQRKDLGLVCYNGEWVFPHMIPADYGPCTEEGATSADGARICQNGRWTDRHQPVALEEEQLEL
jgi:hypothetical protein